jgi:hypothetical protein
MCVRSHAYKEKKKKEGYTPNSRMAAIVLGLKKAGGERERKRSSKQVIDRRVFMYLRMNTFLLFSFVTIRLIAITN